MHVYAVPISAGCNYLPLMGYSSYSDPAVEHFNKGADYVTLLLPVHDLSIPFPCSTFSFRVSFFSFPTIWHGELDNQLESMNFLNSFETKDFSKFRSSSFPIIWHQNFITSVKKMRDSLWRFPSGENEKFRDHEAPMSASLIGQTKVTIVANVKRTVFFFSIVNTTSQK